MLGLDLDRLGHSSSRFLAGDAVWPPAHALAPIGEVTGWSKLAPFHFRRKASLGRSVAGPALARGGYGTGEPAANGNEEGRADHRSRASVWACQLLYNVPDYEINVGAHRSLSLPLWLPMASYLPCPVHCRVLCSKPHNVEIGICSLSGR